MNDEIKTVRAGSFEMRYFCFGRGERIMVIIPGVSIRSVMESAAAVKHAYKLFEDDFTVYVFDRVTDIPEGYTVFDMAEDTAAAMAALGIGDAYIMGASQGGVIGQIIAARHPELVKKLAAAATASANNEISDGIFEKARALAEEGRSRELNLLFAESIYSPEFFARYRTLIEEASALITAEDMKRFLRMTADLNGFDLREEQEKITCETLVIAGSEDRIFGADASRELAERLGCELCVLEGFGHAVFDETDEFKEIVYRFFMR